MKKIRLLFIFLMFSNFSYSQSKAETETWIKSFISTYSNGTINFQNGILTHEDPYDPMGFHVKASVAIKDLAGVKVSGGTKGHTAIFLSCYDGQCVNDGLKPRENANFDNFKNNKLSMQMSSEISEDLQKRIAKAINHLIKLYGGKSMNDTF